MSSRRATAQAEKRRTTFRRTTTPIDPRNRLIALLVAFVVIGAGFVAVLVDLQTVRSERYRMLGEDQRTRIRQIAGYRGAIVDRNGFVLAASTPSHQIVADPAEIEDPAATAAVLAPILGIDATILTEQLTPSSEDDHFSLLARHVDDAAVAQVQQMRSVKSFSDALIGIWVKPEESRVYPAGALANAVVGRVDPDEQGIFGVEKIYNDLMTGEPGTEQIERGRFGSISVGDWKVDPATAGFDVVLTLDHRIQYMTEQTLLEQCEATEANGATAVMSDPHTGEILAMASVERVDGVCALTGYNAALINTFEPGSVIKPLVVAAATEENGLTADSTFAFDDRLVVGDKAFSDHPEHPAAPYPVSEILAQSMNVGTIVISRELPPETMYDYLLDFGLTRTSGMEFPGESPGTLRHPDDWWGSDYGAIPIGQGVTVNAAQLLSAYNVLANGGTFVAPSLVRSIDTKDGVIHSGEVAVPQRVISTRTSQELIRSLEAVVDHGTGTEAAVEGYRVAGKTGTAWKVFDDGTGTLTFGTDGNRRYVVSFVGFMPAENPRLSMVVVVDEPRTDTTASAVAAPIFSEVAGYAARILPITPTEVPVSDGSRVRGTPAGMPEELAGPEADERPGTGRTRTGGTGSDETAAAEPAGNSSPGLDPRSGGAPEDDGPAEGNP